MLFCYGGRKLRKLFFNFSLIVLFFALFSANCYLTAGEDRSRQSGRKITSATGERAASLEAVKRYQIFCEKNAEMLEKELQYFPPEKGLLADDLENRFTNRDFIVFLNSVNEKTSKHIAPSRKTVNPDTFKMSSAVNEWESLQIGIWALKALKKFSWEISDLVHENGLDRILGAGKNVRRYYPYNVFAKKQESREVTPDMDIDPERVSKNGVVYYQEEPVVLLDLPDIDIEPDTAQALWLDIFTGKATAPGNYTGKIIFKVDGKQVGDKPLVLTVYPFELDEAGDWSRGAYLSKFIDREEAVNLMENGHNQVSWWTTGGYSIKLENGKINADFSPYAEYLDMLDHAGMKGPHAIFLGGSTPKLHNKIFGLLGRKGIKHGRNKKYREQYPASDLSMPFESYLVQTLKQFRVQMKACDHENILAVMLDEPDHRPRPERLNWYNKTYQMVEKGVPGLQTMGVFYHKDDEKKLSHNHAVWSTNCPSMAKYNACKKAGRKLYTYHGGYKFYDKPGKFRFSIGIIPWVYDATGTFYWAIWNHGNDERYLDDIFSPDTFEGNSTTIARTPDNTDYGPLSTLAHKGFREAVDDARYIRTLEKLIQSIESVVEAAGRNKTAEEAAAGREAEKQKKWLTHIQTTLRRKLHVKGGHVVNHTTFADWHFPVAGLKFKNSRGEEFSMEQLDIFSEFIRQDVIRRINKLLKYREIRVE